MVTSVNMDELSNPYRPGAGTRPPALVGRDDLIDQFAVAARRARSGRPGKSVMPIGLRGVGKTVLLNRYVEIAEHEGFAVGHLEASDTDDFRMLLADRVRTVLLALQRRGSGRAVLRALRVLKTFSLQLPDGSKVAVDVDPLLGYGDSGHLPDDVTELLLAAGEAAASLSQGVLLAIDEVQYLTRDELGALITAIHRSTQRDLPVVLVGAGLPQLPGLAGEARSYAERLFTFPPVGSLNDHHAAAALSVPSEEVGVEITREALTRIVAASGGYPYFLQEWGYHVWNHAPGSPITATHVDGVAPAVERALDGDFFRVRFDRLTPKEREYLRAMAALGPGPVRSGEVAAELGVRVQGVAPRRAGLIAKGMLYSPAHGDTAFTVPLFDQFLRRAMP